MGSGAENEMKNVSLTTLKTNEGSAWEALGCSWRGAEGRWALLVPALQLLIYCPWRAGPRQPAGCFPFGTSKMGEQWSCASKGDGCWPLGPGEVTVPQGNFVHLVLRGEPGSCLQLGGFVLPVGILPFVTCPSDDVLLSVGPACCTKAK